MYKIVAVLAMNKYHSKKLHRFAKLHLPHVKQEQHYFILHKTLFILKTISTALNFPGTKIPSTAQVLLASSFCAFQETHIGNSRIRFEHLHKNWHSVDQTLQHKMRPFTWIYQEFLKTTKTQSNYQFTRATQKKEDFRINFD